MFTLICLHTLKHCIVPIKRYFSSLAKHNHYLIDTFNQDCHMVYFHSKTPDLGLFLRALDWKMLVYFMALFEYFTAIWYILWPFVIFYGHLVNLWKFGFSSVLVYCNSKNLAILLSTGSVKSTYALYVNVCVLWWLELNCRASSSLFLYTLPKYTRWRWTTLESF
jgi:hypothetical protein